MAMKAVVRRIEHPGSPARRHVLAPKLIVRDTTAKPLSHAGGSNQ